MFSQKLDNLKSKNRHRSLQRIGGIDLSSNDYLGFKDHPILKQAAIEALQNGVSTGAGGSRLLRGNAPEHEALEDFAFDGLGNGPTTYRKGDHQCFKDVLVVRGAENPSDEYNLVEIVEVTPVEQVTYDPEHPMFAGGNLGSCNAGV